MRRRKIISFVLAGIMALSNITTFDITSFASETTELTSESEAATEVVITDEEISEETVTETEETTTEISSEETETTTEVTTEEVTEGVTTEDEEDITGFVKLSVDYDTLLSDISFSVYDGDDTRVAVYIVSDAKVSFIDLLTDKDILYEQEDDTLLSLAAGDYYLQMDETLYDGDSAPTDAGVLYDDSKVKFTVTDKYSEVENPCEVKVTLNEYLEATKEITEEETEVVEATENNETTEEVTEETTEEVTYVTAANETENAVSSESIVLTSGTFGSLTASNVSEEDTEEDTEEETEEEADTEIIVFDHYYSDIDESLVETTDLIVTTSDESIFTKNTNVISNYDNAYIISCESVEEARYVYSYYADKVDTISDLSKNISVATEDDTEDVADLSDINNSDDALSTLNDIDTKNYSGYIALIDTGADADVNFSVIGDDTSDTNGHGTKMLNLIKENNPDAKVMSIKVSEGSKTDAASIYAGIMLAIESKVSVINLSMVGYDTTSNAIVKEAIEEAINSGITVIGAAGNYNMSAKKFIPGSIDGVIVVGAVNEDGTKYSSSNTDADVYVVATSTSEATAIYTGLYTADKLDDERIFTSLQTDTTADTDNEDSEADTEDTEVDYVVNEDGSITFVFDIEYFESLEGFEIADSYSTAATTSLGEVKYSAMPTSLGSSSNYEEGTCTLKNASSSGYGYASGFTHTGGNNSAFTTFLNATGKSASSFNVCCERHWYSNYSDSASYHALAQLNGSKYFRAWVSDLDLTPDDEGKVSCTFTLLVSEKSDFSVTWDSKSTDVSWKVYSSYESSGNVYSVSYSINGGSKVSIYSGVRLDNMNTDTVVSTVASAIASVTSTTASLATEDFGGVRNFTPSETTIKSNIYSTISSVIGTSSDTGDKKVTFSWDETEDYQIYEGKIGAWAYANTYLTITKKVNDDYSDFLTYCESVGLDYYSLVGTKFVVYTDSTCSEHVKDVNGKNVTFTVSGSSDTDSNGNPYQTFELDSSYANQTVWIVEEAVGTGYKFNSNYKKGNEVTLAAAGKTKTVNISNTPMNDYFHLNLVKISDKGGSNTAWSGETSPVGATYTITGYSLGSGNSKGTKFATWYATTDDNGKIKFTDPTYYTSDSDDLYTDSNGLVCFPIGYYTIKETALDTTSGTEINSTTYTYIIYPSDDNTGTNAKLLDGDTVIYTRTVTDGSFTSNYEDYYVTLADGTKVKGYSKSDGCFYTIEPEVWAKLGLFKTDENYIATGYTNNNTVLKTSNAGTSFDGAVFYIYVDSNKVDNYDTSTKLGTSIYYILKLIL